MQNDRRDDREAGFPEGAAIVKLKASNGGLSGRCVVNIL